MLSQNGDGVDRRQGDRAQERARARRTSSAASLFESREYRQLLRVHQELLKLAGTPPFQLKLGDDEAEALSFEELRAKVLELAKRGVQLQRFKGLGEMNADQLRETTMDPATRTLQQVTIDDALRRRPAVLDADGRPGRAAAGVHREARKGRAVPGCLARRMTATT